MTSGDRPEVFALLSDYFATDPFYLESSAAQRGAAVEREAMEAALGRALALFADRPDYGFVWMAFENGRAVGCAAISYAISFSAGAIGASLDMLTVGRNERGRGIGAELVESLIAQLEASEVGRLDVAVHLRNEAARSFFERLGFAGTNEERLSLLLG